MTQPLHRSPANIVRRGLHAVYLPASQVWQVQFGKTLSCLHNGSERRQFFKTFDDLGAHAAGCGLIAQKVNKTLVRFVVAKEGVS